jgi:hypothetical protein
MAGFEDNGNISKHNGSIKAERYGDTLLVYVPQLKWYQLGVPYTSELERVLGPAIHHEEAAMVVAPDKTTSFFLTMEKLAPHIPVVIGEREAKRIVDRNTSFS